MTSNSGNECIIINLFSYVYVLLINYYRYGRFSQLLADKSDGSDSKSVRNVAILVCENEEVNDPEEVEEFICSKAAELETAMNTDSLSSNSAEKEITKS